MTMVYIAPSDLPMASRCNKVEQGMDTIIPESWVTLDTRFFRKDVIILTLKMSNDLRETMLC